MSERAEEPDEDEGSESPERTPTPQLHHRSSTPRLQRPNNRPISDLPGFRMTPSGSRRWRHVGEMDLFFHRMQQMQNSCVDQIQQNQEGEERMVNSILQSNSTMVSAWMEGIHSLHSQPSMAPYPYRYTEYEYPPSGEHRPVYHTIYVGTALATYTTG